MKRLKIFPKIFLYTLLIMLLIVAVSHTAIYLLAPQMQLSLVRKEDYVVSINESLTISQAITHALPWSVGFSLVISVVCSLLLSKALTDPIKQISTSTERMMALDPAANCSVHTKDEIGTLAQNVNEMYVKLLATIKNLEQEKDNVQEMERAKVDFLRAASHELKTPVTALNATLENMILGVGKYQDYAVYLPECKEMVEQLSGMIQEILETSRLNISDEAPRTVDISDLLAELCEPYQMIAAAHHVTFNLDLPEQFMATVQVKPLSKAVSNILSNAVAYTEAGKTVSVYLDEGRLVVENECVPIPDNEIRRLFEPFYRPDFSRSRENGGNGLGLYIVDTLLTSMNISYFFEPIKMPVGMRFTVSVQPDKCEKLDRM